MTEDGLGFGFTRVGASLMVVSRLREVQVFKKPAFCGSFCGLYRQVLARN